MDELTTDRLRLALAGAGLDAITDGHHPAPVAGLRRAAVLILFDADRDPRVVLTERSPRLRQHAGQISFPGGRVDPGESARAAALREAWEECAIVDAGVRVLGELPASSLPVSSFAVTPVVAVWDGTGPLEPTASPDEVDAVHMVKVADLADPDNRGTWWQARTTASGGARLGGAAFAVDGLVIWGFTAMILDGVLEVAGWTRPWDTERVIDVLPKS
ncbi:CoA pyrophosphatase [Trueperella pyogenes]|uniref:NUDIX hydrolase n=1 Tax=Trueperella pyogenes TaxID=1661 RepID=UPI001ADA1D36|nr:CoA pyrophosphatase [Trueperella pyogenes]